MLIYVAPVLISENCDINISTRRLNVFVFLVLMLMSQVSAYAYVLVNTSLMGKWYFGKAQKFYSLKDGAY